MRNDPCFPCMERPPKCFLTSVTHNVRISCNKKGILSTTTNGTTNEEFYILEGSDGTTIFQHVPTGRILVSTPDGDIVTAPPLPPSSSSSSSSPSSPSSSSDTKVVKEEEETEYYRSWYVHKDSRNGEYAISSIETAQYLAYQQLSSSPTTTDDQKKKLYTSEERGRDTNRWKVELRTGELCFVTSLDRDVRLTCGPNGTIAMSENWKGWEVWRFTEVGDGDVWISSWTHGKALCETFAMGDEEGSSGRSGYGPTGSTVRYGVGTTDEREKYRWRIERAPNGYDGVVIRSRSSGRYLICNNNNHDDGGGGDKGNVGGVSTSRLFDGAKTTWQLAAAHGQRYYVSSVAYDRRIGCRNNTKNKEDDTDNVVYTTTNRNDTETWELQKLDNGLVVFKSTLRDAYLSCFDDDDDDEKKKTAQLRAVELFTDKAMWKLQHTSASNKGLRIVSKLQDLALCCDEHGTLSLASNTTDHPSSPNNNNKQKHHTELLWTLEPSLPQSVTKNQMLTLATGGALAVASVALMPLAVVGVVGALGFTSTGIATGSIAAGMMSAEAAAAAGGAIAAGGTVATLQSIGAAGLGLAGTSAAMGGGAIVGASALGVSVAASGVGKKVFEEGGGVLETLEVRENRPFCDWSSW